MADEIIRVSNLKKYYRIGKTGGIKANVLRAVDDITLSVGKGRIFGVVGESGCGKSTLGRCILRLTEITGGEVYFKDENISRAGQHEMRRHRRNMQMVFQNPFSSFNPKIRIGSSLQEVGDVYHLKREKTAEKIKELLDYANLAPDTLKRHSGELSGGQLQRLAIVRALLLEPIFLLADEPVSALDVSVQAQILNLILDLRDKLNLTIMFISHDLTVIENVCDEAAVLYLGTVVEKAPVSKLFGNVNHPYTQALISAKPKENPRDSVSRIILQGDMPNAIDIPAGCRFASRCPYFKSGICNKEVPALKEVSDGHFIACHKFN